MAAEPLVLSEFDPSTGIARLVLNRPDALNAIDQSMAESFLAAVGTALERDGLRCVLISGAGRAFAAGGDVKAFSDPATAGQVIDAILRPMHEAVLALRRCPVPVVTAVRGIAAGGASPWRFAAISSWRQKARNSPWPTRGSAAPRTAE